MHEFITNKFVIKNDRQTEKAFIKQKILIRILITNILVSYFYFHSFISFQDKRKLKKVLTRYCKTLKLKNTTFFKV